MATRGFDGPGKAGRPCRAIVIASNQMSDPKPGERPEHEEGAEHEAADVAPPAPRAGTAASAPATDPDAPVGAPAEQRVRIGDVRALPPHVAARGVAEGAPVDFKRSARRGRFKLAVTSTFALAVVFLELCWVAPGVGIAFGVLAAPLMVYLIRVTRTYMEDESSFRRGMANTGTIVVTILGANLFLFVSFATIFWIICGKSTV